MKNKFPFGQARLFLFYSFLLSSFPGFAQTNPENLRKTILSFDSLFWQAYNNCDLKNMEKYFAADVEFYHDKGGPSKGITQIMETTKRNLCSNNNFRLRREVVPGTTELYPLFQHDTIYGAILTGEHVFYIIENNDPPRLDGQARFTHLWLLKDNAWKMSTVLSYDHHAAIIQKKMIQLAASTLELYAGKYTAPNTGKLTVLRAADHLLLLIQDQKFELYPESENKFFTKERNLVFEFTRGADGKVDKMNVWENGKIAETAIRVK